MSIRIVARDHLREECREAAFELLKELIECSRAEEGNIAYDYCQDTEHPECFAMIEHWKDEEAVKLHMNSEHFTRIIPQLAEMAAEPGRMEVYKQVL